MSLPTRTLGAGPGGGLTVSAQGKPLDVQVVGNPGHGLGRAAQRCAWSKTYLPKLDRSGTPLTSTITIVVTFERR